MAYTRTNLVRPVAIGFMTDTMGRMHSDAQFAGSSSVPAHVEMMGFLGIGNNPMVGCTVACASKKETRVGLIANPYFFPLS